MTIDDDAFARTLHELVRDPVVPADLGRRAVAAHVARRRRLTVAAATAVAALAVTAVALPRGDRARPASSGLVGADGIVWARPGKPVLFCMDKPSWRTLPDADRCQVPTTVDDVRLDALADRQDKGGVVWGRAWLAGRYVDGRLVVARQEPAHPAPARDPGATLSFSADCSPPPGGWHPGQTAPGATPAPDANADLAPYRAFTDAHPGEVAGGMYTGGAAGRPGLVIAAEHPDLVDAALRPYYGDGLCVVRTRYTAAQVRDAEAAAAAYAEEHGSLSGRDLQLDGQPRVAMTVPAIDEELRAILARQPEGLVRVTEWLRPVE